METIKLYPNLRPQVNLPPPDKAEFESGVERLPWSGCWIWSRSVASSGYGDFRRSGKHYLAHRYSYQLYTGPIPTGLHVLHRCDVRGCVNPLHLFVGTNADNIRDAGAKGRRSGPRNRPKGLIYHRRSATAYDSLRLATPEQCEKMRELRAEGLSYAKIGRLFGMSATTARNSILRLNGHS